MKRNYRYIILAILLGVLLGIVVLAIEIFIDKESKKLNSELKFQTNKAIETKTITELMQEATNQVYEGTSRSDAKIAYITIDDGPSEYTNQILDILDDNDVKATFFMIDGNMKKRPEEVKRVTFGGHGTGFHSVSHDVQKLYKTPEATLTEFNKCNDTYENITGKASKLIRLPYGSKPYTPEESYNILARNNYLIWDWNLDTEDWKVTTDNIVSNVLYHGRNKNNLIILLHEKEQSVEALDSIIKVLKNRGYTILPINESTQPQNYWEKNL